MDEDFQPSKEQLMKAKKTLLFLINKDPDIIMAIKNVNGRFNRRSRGTPLTRSQVVDRIRTGCAAYDHKGHNNAYRLKEIIDRFKEYSTHEIRRMIEEADILVREVKKEVNGQKQRFLILDLYSTK